MRRKLTVTIAFLAMSALLGFPQSSSSSSASSSSKPVGHEIDHSQAEVKQALEVLKAYETGKLPLLDGFIDDNISTASYERPFYQYDIHLSPDGAYKTLVRVQAKITAWYTDPIHGSPEYRSLRSNGRLESDLLDRLDKYFKKIDSDLGARIKILQDRLAEIQKNCESLEKERDQLLADNKDSEAILQSQAAPLRLAAITNPKSGILARPETTARMIMKAEREDLFPIVDERPGWLHVKLGDQTGWILRSAATTVSAEDQVTTKKMLAQAESNFAISHEEVTQFLGEWPGLREKKALFIYVQLVGISYSDLATEKLNFIKQVFSDRYRQAVHSTTDYSGIVIIFTGARAGIAAAKLEDIGDWVNGRINEPAFLKRCSLDPPDVFRAAIR